MVDAADAATSFVSVEIDATRAEASAGLFAGQPNVHVINANWTELRAFGPFDLLVLDGGGKGKEPGDDPPLDPTDGWLTVDGTIVLDDFTPGDNAHDDARRYWLSHFSPPGDGPPLDPVPLDPRRPPHSIEMVHVVPGAGGR
jgi:hypothetical protein